MASRYDDLDASLELEQRIAADLRLALEPRGCQIIHHGSSSGARHSPGGKPDIEIRDAENSHLILVEVTKRKGSAADGEFAAVTDHLNREAAKRKFDKYGLLYVSPSTSARMSMNFRDLYNRSNEREGKPGRIVALDFEAMQLMLDKLISSDPGLYPSSRFVDLFERWDTAVDDARARQLVQSTLFPEDNELASELEEEAQEFDALRERNLKKSLERVEDKFRSHGITGNNANISLVYLAFLRLFEERSQRRTGKVNRFTLDGFSAWKENVARSIRRDYQNRLVEFLLHEIAEEDALKEAGLLQNYHSENFLHHKLTDELVETLILPVFDEYDFHAGRVDILGAVFETLARRGDKDTRVGQFFTPQQVVDFCTEIVDLRWSDHVMDPAVGTGRFLISAMEVMLDDSDEGSQHHYKTQQSIRQKQLLGSDIDEWVATIAKMNMFIHGDGKSGIISANGLTLGQSAIFPRTKKGVDGSLDVVLTNPPLGDTDYLVAESEWERTAQSQSLPCRAEDFYEWLGVVPLETIEEKQLASLVEKREEVHSKISELMQDPTPKSRSAVSRYSKKLDTLNEQIADLRVKIAQNDITRQPRGRTMKGGALFIGAIARYLKKERWPGGPIEWSGGRAAIVVDEAVLNTSEYKDVRSFIRRNFFVKAVISLSRDAFKYLAHTDAKTSILYLVKKPDTNLEQREPVFYSHAERVGYNAVGKWIGNDLPQIRDFYRYFREEVIRGYQGRYFRIDEVTQSVQSIPGHSTVFFVRPPGEDISERLDFYHARLQQRKDELLAKHGELIRFGDIFEVSPRVSPPASRTGEYDFAVATRTGTISFKGRASVSYSPRDLWVVQKGDLVLSSIDLVNGAVAVAGEEVNGLVMSKEMYSYRPKEGVAVIPDYVQILLRTKAAQEMLLGFATGTSNRTRLDSVERLLDFPLPPLPPLHVQEQKAEQLRHAYEAQRSAVLSIERMAQEAQEIWGPPEDVYSDDESTLPVVSAK
ncbi:N-6 DNA methylase [Nocardiopsis sp. FR4]|uniref:N-6 DNA methylase n=1 Tax=Nocardiopsis sp. FR4 TaxID=2605985 RepID=UPI00135CABEC|nr:N-6 DNA methylase [Nocardiopsis sp. FR4]